MELVEEEERSESIYRNSSPIRAGVIFKENDQWTGSLLPSSQLL
jgi:hypothetical protein